MEHPAPQLFGRDLITDAHDDEVKDAHRQVERLLNISSHKARPTQLAYLLATDHRTLQQIAMRELILPFLAYLAHAYSEGRYDPRNEGSCHLAMRLIEVVEGEGPWPLPMI